MSAQHFAGLRDPAGASGAGRFGVRMRRRAGEEGMQEGSGAVAARMNGRTDDGWTGEPVGRWGASVPGGVHPAPRQSLGDEFPAAEESKSGSPGLGFRTRLRSRSFPPSALLLLPPPGASTFSRLLKNSEVPPLVAHKSDFLASTHSKKTFYDG